MRKLETILLATALALAIAGCGEGTPPPSAGGGGTTTSNAAAQTADGAAVYERLCTTCHTAGIAGAPKLGDAADWAPRIAQGEEVLYDHSIKGFTGAKGMMPAKGGNPALSDAEVRAAVDYMVSAVR